MPQLSKLTRSRDEWRTKAVLRATENREYRKADKRNKEQLIALKTEVSVFKNLRKPMI